MGQDKDAGNEEIVSNGDEEGMDLRKEKGRKEETKEGTEVRGRRWKEGMEDRGRQEFGGRRRKAGFMEVKWRRGGCGGRREQSGGDCWGATQHEHKRAVVSGRTCVPL